jgi:hypothetical protein
VGKLVEPIINEEGETTRGCVVERVCTGELESDTVKVTEALPFEVGSPEMTPLLPRVSPAGSPVADQM